MADCGVTVPARCPRCAARFAVARADIASFAPCPACGETIVLRPEAVQDEIERKARTVTGSPGAPLAGGRVPVVGVLDDVRSAWNVGSMFRSADGAGLERLLLCGITGCPPDAKLSKVALSADTTVPWAYCADVVAACEQLRAAGYRIVALETGPDACPLAAYRPAGPCALVVGNEVRGIHPVVLRRADAVLAIPMRGHKTSLNTAVAFALAAYHLAAGLWLPPAGS